MSNQSKPSNLGEIQGLFEEVKIGIVENDENLEIDPVERVFAEAGLFGGLDQCEPVRMCNLMTEKREAYSGQLDALREEVENMQSTSEAVDAMYERLVNGEITDEDLSNTEGSMNYCNYCNIQFANNKGLCMHYIDRHMMYTRRDTFDCAVCKEKQTSFDRFLEHFKKHLEHKRCPLCGITLNNNGAMHIAESHSYVDRITGDFICDYCSFKTGDIDELRFHSMTCTNNPKNPNYDPTEEGRVCNKCSQVFNTNLQMIKHKEAKHQLNADGTEIQTYSCEECGQIFGSIRSLHGHRRKHANKPRNPIASMMIPTTVNVGIALQKKKSNTGNKSTLSGPQAQITEAYEDMPDL